MEFKKVFQNRVFMGAVIYLVYLYFLEEFIFDYPQTVLIQIIFIFRPLDEKLIAVLSTFASSLLCFWFAWISLSIPRKFQIIPILLISASSLIQYGFWKAVGRFISAVDLQIATATSLETWKGAQALYFNWQFVLPIMGFIIVLFFFSDTQQQSVTRKHLMTLSLYLMLLCYSYTFTNKTLNLGLSIPSFYQTILRFAFENLESPARKDVGFQQSNQPANNILLVIDESIRGDHLGINGYYRDTTPFLAKLIHENLVRNWGLAVAGATCSHPSNALILTGVRPGLDKFELTTIYPTIFQYAKAMGYKTYYMDAQTNTIWNGLTTNDFKYIDVWVKAEELGDDIQSDFRAADIIKTFTQESGKFIVLNKRGVHFLYENSYPQTSEIWYPIPSDYYSQPELAANSYDNGIHYNVNTFFERLLADRHMFENTIILYTADHGQTLFEDGATWLHCNYTPEEATVPLLMIGKNLPNEESEKFSASHSNILPTLLDIMGIPLEKRMYSYAPSLYSPSLDLLTKRFFLDGSLRLIEFQTP